MKAMALNNRWIYASKEAAIDLLARKMKLKAAQARRGGEYYTQQHIWHPDGDLSLKGTEYAIPVYLEQINAKGPLTSLANQIDQSYLAEAFKDLPKR